MMNSIVNYLNDVKQCLNEINENEIFEIINVIFDAYKHHKRIFILGNGGSAATSSHFACDLSKGTIIEGKPRLAAISLTDNIALMTAISNDLDYSVVFKEQLVNLLDEGDVVIGISASGNSPNVLEAIRYANTVGAQTIGFCGFGGGGLCEMAGKSIVFSRKDYRQVEDAQMVLTHLISLEVRRKIEGQ